MIHYHINISTLPYLLTVRCGGYALVWLREAALPDGHSCLHLTCLQLGEVTVCVVEWAHNAIIVRGLCGGVTAVL